MGLKDLAKPSPFHIRSKTHAEEEKMPKDEQRESRLLGYIAKDDPVLDRLKSQKGKRYVARGSPLEHPKRSSEPNGPIIGAW